MRKTERSSHLTPQAAELSSQETSDALQVILRRRLFPIRYRQHFGPKGSVWQLIAATCDNGSPSSRTSNTKEQTACR